MPEVIDTLEGRNCSCKWESKQWKTRQRKKNRLEAIERYVLGKEPIRKNSGFEFNRFPRGLGPCVWTSTNKAVPLEEGLRNLLEEQGNVRIRPEPR